MTKLARRDVEDSLIPNCSMTAFQVARMLALRGCLEGDGRADEERVRRHLAALARDGRVARDGRSDNGCLLWRLLPTPRRRRGRMVA